MGDKLKELSIDREIIDGTIKIKNENAVVNCLKIGSEALH